MSRTQFYRAPRKGVTVPIPFGLDVQGAQACEAWERQALVDLFSGTGSKDSLETLTSSCGTSIHALRLAIKRPKHHTLDPAQLAPALEVMYDHARALHAIRERYDRVGVVGMSGPERLQLESFVDDAVEVRKGITRRMYRDALNLSLMGPLEVPPKDEDRAA